MAAQRPVRPDINVPAVAVQAAIRHSPHNQPLLKFMSLLNKLLLELLPSPLWPNLEALLKRRLVHPHTVRTFEMSR